MKRPPIGLHDSQYGEFIDIIRTGLSYYRNISPKTFKALRSWCIATEKYIEASLHYSYMPKILDRDIDGMD